MTALREAAQQALEAWDTRAGIDTASRAFEALRAALAEPAQEPVASIYITPEGEREFDDWRCDLPVGRTELYAAPPQRKPLTDEQIDDIWVEHGCEGEDAYGFARAVETAHGIKEGT